MISDPGTNVELEDVLSSIRRLISQDAAVRQAPVSRRDADASPSAGDPPQDEAALLLTPALRVGEAAEAVEDDPPQEAVPEMVDVDGSSDDTDDYEGEVIFDDDTPFLALPETRVDLGEELNRLEDTIAEMEAAVARSGAEFEPEKGDSFEPSDVMELTAQFGTESTAAPASDRHVSEVPASTAPLPETAPSHEAETEEVNTSSDAVTDPNFDDESWEAESPEWAEEAHADRANLAIALSDKVMARLHLQSTEGTFDTDVAPATAALHSVAGDSVPGQDAGGKTADGDVAPRPLPEDALRDLVAEMIRQELQGALGERITRNVRKLVRREIQRALATKDFE